MRDLARVERDAPPSEYDADLSIATEIVDLLRGGATSLDGHVDSVSAILGDRLSLLTASPELQASTRRAALQRYASAREDWQRLLSMLSQAEDRLATESKVFAAVDELTRL